MALLSLICAVTLFNGLSDEQHQRLAAISEEGTFNAGDAIVEQCAPGNKLYFITEGQMKVRVRGETKQGDPPQAHLGRGRVFGDMTPRTEGRAWRRYDATVDTRFPLDPFASVQCAVHHRRGHGLCGDA